MAVNREVKKGLGSLVRGILLMGGLACGATAQAAPAVGTPVLFADPLAGIRVEAPVVPLKAGNCTPSATILCLNGGRFRVSVAWNQAGGANGVGSVVPGFTSDSGLFWFFAPTNYEIMVKVLNGCSVNNRHWVFFLATTDVGFTLTITDTMTQTTKSYQNPLGKVSPVITDTEAFNTCP